MSRSIVLERLPAAALMDVNSGQDTSRQRIYILPTRQGFSYLLLLVVMLLGAVNYNNSMAYLLTFLLGSLLLIGILHTYRNLSELIITGQFAPPVFAGDTAEFPISIDNRFGQRRLSLTFSRYQRTRRLFSIGVGNSLFDIDIPAGKIRNVNLHQVTHKRGYLLPDRIVLSTTFPLGLFRAWSYLDLTNQCLVYPRAQGQQPLPATNSGKNFGKEDQSPGVNDFIGFRKYHFGDSIRNIAWKALARDHDLLVKRFSGETGDTLVFKWNQPLTNDIEDRLSQLCKWLLQAEKNNLLYGLEIPGKTFKPAHGESHLNQCLSALATWDETRGW